MTKALNGYDEIELRMDMWRTSRGYLLVPKCCPCTFKTGPHAHCGRGGAGAFDHGKVWERPDGSRFFLAHPYPMWNEELRQLLEYADRWGLRVQIGDGPRGDNGWYENGTVPVLLEKRHAST